MSMVEAEMARLTIFTAPKAFRDPHIALIQTNAIRSWRQWGKEVDVLVIGQEDGLSEAAAGLGVRHLPDVQRNTQGTPLVSSIFELARRNSTTGLLAYVNADILLLPDFLERAAQIATQVEKFLVVGQRWDLDVKEALNFGPGWQAALWQDVLERGRLHPPAGSDYFIFPRGCFDDMPAFAIGRAGWDNWMIFQARAQGWPVIDATGSINIIHQDHDYSHLPGSQSHYRLPETLENIRLAGGRRAIFSLADADWTINDGRLLRRPLRGARLLREIETYPLVKLKSGWLAEMFFAIFHPKKAWGELRGRLAYKLGVGGN
jgi:hypothetical protein